MTPKTNLNLYNINNDTISSCLNRGQIEICAGSLRYLRNLVSAQADSKFAQVCVSARYGYKIIPIYILLKWIYLVDLNTDTSIENNNNIYMYGILYNI